MSSYRRFDEAEKGYFYGFRPEEYAYIHILVLISNDKSPIRNND